MENDVMKNIDTSDEGVLKRFMEELFDFDSLCEAGFFKKEWKHDYQKQAKRVCKFFGYKTVYEYRAEETRCHISYSDPEEARTKPFITVFPSIYE